MDKFKSGAACARCQRWLSTARSHKWMSTPCAPPRLAVTPGFRSQPTAGPEENAHRPHPLPAGASGAEARGADIASSSHGPLLDIDDPEGDPVSTPEAPSGPELGPEDDLEDLLASQAGLISVSAAKAKRKKWRAEHTAVTRSNKDTIREAATEAGQASTSVDLAAALANARARPGSEAPAWVSFAHESHDLLTIGGVVFCIRCGSKVAKQVRVSLLKAACRGYLTEEVVRLRRGLLPTNVKDWPSGGSLPQDPRSLRKVI